ncbi:MAG: tryptophan-rich sensory protein [Legionellales bacterium]|nr:tryptophan-rich sensory protein [Legionellales bacterium]|tara:strand:- start:10879 stop:11349 length:471 start_codon:yes stop_codon:yes gene_type:complete
MSKKIIQLFLWIVVLQLVGYGMGLITQTSVDSWYLTINKSSLTPPGYVFGIAWGILYTLLGIVGWQLFQAQSTTNITPLRSVFVAQLLLNWSWTPLFFYLHWTGAALLCLLAIVVLTTIFLLQAWRPRRVLCWLMLPYWLWVCFAAYLNMIIWLSN